MNINGWCLVYKLVTAHYYPNPYLEAPTTGYANCLSVKLAKA